MLSLKEFQKKCLCIKKMHDENEFDALMIGLLQEHEDKRLMAEWEKVREEQLKYGDSYKPIKINGNVLGIRMERCPCCNEVISKELCPCCKEVLKKDFIKMEGGYEYHIMWCSHCEYKYARAKKLK